MKKWHPDSITYHTSTLFSLNRFQTYTFCSCPQRKSHPVWSIFCYYNIYSVLLNKEDPVLYAIKSSSLSCSIISLTKISKWGSQYYLNRNLGPYFHLGQEMLFQNPSPLTLLSSLLSPFLSCSPSPSGQSAEIVAVAEDDPRTEEAVAEEIPDTKHVCWPPDIFLANTWRCIWRIKFLF